MWNITELRCRGERTRQRERSSQKFVPNKNEEGHDTFEGEKREVNEKVKGNVCELADTHTHQPDALVLLVWTANSRQSGK